MASDLVFFGEGNGAFATLDARTDELLRHFPANQGWKASPMTRMTGGRQYVAIGFGLDYRTFALADGRSDLPQQ